MAQPPEADRDYRPPTLPPPPGLPGDQADRALSARLALLEDQLRYLLSIPKTLERWSGELLDPGGKLDQLHQAMLEQTNQIVDLREEVTAVKLHLEAAEHLHAGDHPKTDPCERPFLVVLVDDVTEVAAAIERVLRREGLDVLTASGGDEAIRLLEEHQVDVVLSDLRMPGNGSTLLAHVREHHPDVSFVMMSGYPEGETLDPGVFVNMEKPFANSELRDTVVRAAEYARRNRGAR